MSNVTCDRTGCDHNTGFTKECMISISTDVMLKAISGDFMCDMLREKTLEYMRKAKLQRYTKEGTGEFIFLRRDNIWYDADIVRLLSYRDTTIHMHYTAWKRMKVSFGKMCNLRNITVEVVF